MKNVSCGCSFPNFDYPRITKSSANQLLARGSKLCQEVSEMDALLSSRSNFFSESTEKPSITEPSTATTGLSNFDDVPKVFIQSNSYEENLPPHSDTIKCSSFIQKIMNNAKTMLSTKCNAIHPSSCSEEPTRETDNCQYDSNATILSTSRTEESRSFPKYSPSDYCLCDADGQDSSSKLDLTTTAETLPKEISREETLSSSKKTYALDRGILESIYSSDTNSPCSCSNDAQSFTAYDTSKCLMENSTKGRKGSKSGYKAQDVQFDNSVKYFQESSCRYDDDDDDDDICVKDDDNPSQSLRDGSICVSKSTVSSEDVNSGLEKADTGRRMFSLLDTTWLNPFRRDQPKKSNITNKTKLESRNHIDNNFNIPCRDVTCYRTDGGLRPNSAEPCKRKHPQPNENGHISRTISNADKTVGDVTRIKARSCDPTCTVCTKKKLNALNKHVVSTGCDPDAPTIETGTKISYHQCDPNCPLCSQRALFSNNVQRHTSRIETNVARHHEQEEPDRPPIVNTSVGSAKVRNVVFDIVDKCTGANSIPTRTPSKESSPVRFIEEAPSIISNHKTLEMSEDTGGGNSNSNPGSQQDSACNSLSCQLSYTSVKQSKLSCKLSCPLVTANNVKYSRNTSEKRKYVHRIETYPTPKRVRSSHEKKDEDNQCAFIGSPVLNPANFKGNGTDGSCYPFCPKCNTNVSEYSSSYRQDDFDRMRERDMYCNSRIGSPSPQLEIRYVDRRYDPYWQHNSYLNHSPVGAPIDDELERVTRELKTENKVLKSELMEMKLELRHALEKVEGPMKSKLEAEKSRCEQLQHELQKASFEMKVSHDTFVKESLDLKTQLSLASTNKNQLEAINKRLRDEMNVLDGLCGKLEEDLVNQKLNEAETLKRLTKRNGVLNDLSVLEGICGKLDDDLVNQKLSNTENMELATRKNTGDFKSATDTLNESNLNIIARKLSRTIKETEPCEECAILPTELTGAVKIIKDLTDMVEKRKAENFSLYAFSTSKTNCSCQSPPCTEETACQCLAIKDKGVSVSKSLLPSKLGIFPSDVNKATKTLFSVPNTFVLEDPSSRNIVHDVRRLRSHSPSADRGDPISNDLPSMKNQYTDPKTADKKINYDPPKFILIEPLMVDKEINYEKNEPCKGDGIKAVQDPNANILTCYMVKTPTCPSNKTSTQDKGSPPTMKDESTLYNSSNCKDVDHPQCEDMDKPCVKNVESKYISCEDFEKSPCQDLEAPPCGDVGKPCFKDKNKGDAVSRQIVPVQQDISNQHEDIQQKAVKFSNCEEEESPRCKPTGKPCTKGEVCEPKDAAAASTSPCWNIGVPCLKTSKEAPKGNKNEVLLVEDLGLSGDKEETSEPLSSTLIDSLLSTDPKSNNNPPSTDEGSSGTEKNENKLVTPQDTNIPSTTNTEPSSGRDENQLSPGQNRSSPCYRFGEPCVKKKKSFVDQQSNKKEENKADKQDYICEPCVVDGPCFSIGRPCAINVQTGKFNQMSGESGPGISTEEPCDTSSQTTETADKMTDIYYTPKSDADPCANVGKPCVQKTGKFNQMSGKSGPGISTEEPCDISSQTTDTSDKMTDIDYTPKTDADPCADVGKPCVKKAYSTGTSGTETHRDVLEDLSAGMHVITTKVQDGNLEVKTEGPQGVIETTLNYLPDGALEVQTQINELEEKSGKENVTPLISGGSDINTSSYIITPSSQHPNTHTESSLEDFVCPQTGKSCAGVFNTPQIKEMQSATTQGAYPRNTGILTDRLESAEKGTRHVIEKKSAISCFCVDQLEKTTSHTVPRKDAGAAPLHVRTKETPVSLEDVSVSSPQQTSQVEISSKSVGDDDTKDTAASSTLPIEMISKCECTLELQADQEITTEGEATSDQETFTNTTSKDHSGTSPEKSPKKEAAITAEPSKADKQESKFAASSQNHDCGCQSTFFPADQSCQCCECKEIGVSTTEYSETIQKTMVQDKFSVKSITDKHGSQLHEPNIKLPDDSQPSKIETIVLPDGTTQPVGTVVRPDGSILRPDGIIIQSDGTIMTKDGKTYPRDTILQPDGTILSKEGEVLQKASVVQSDRRIVGQDGSVQPIGSKIRPDGSIVRPDGIIVQPDGTLTASDGRTFPPGSILQPDGTILSKEGEVLQKASVVQSDRRIVGQDGSVQPIGSKIRPDGSIVRPDGIIVQPDGTLTASDGRTFPPGSILQPDGTILSKEGEVLQKASVVQSDRRIVGQDGSVQPIGSKIRPDGSIVRPDGIIVQPDGTLTASDGRTFPPGSILQPDGTILSKEGEVLQKASVVQSDRRIVGQDGSVQPIGSKIRPDGSIVRPDGIIVQPDGTLTASDGRTFPPGSILQPDGTILSKDGKVLQKASVVQSDRRVVLQDGSVQPIGSEIRPDRSIVGPDGTIIPKSTRGSIIRPDGTYVRSDGTIGVDQSHPVGSIIQPDGTILLPDGTVIAPDGTIHPIGSKLLPDGRIIHPDGTEILKDGTIITPDGNAYEIGSIMQPDGSVLRPDGSIVRPDGSVIRSGWVPNKTPLGKSQELGSAVPPDGMILNDDKSIDSSFKKAEVQPDGSIISADGSVQPKGSILSKDGNIIRPDGSVVRPDGSMIKPDGSIIRKDGSILKPDGSVLAPDGSIHPIGSVLREDGTVIRPDGSIVHTDGSILRSDGIVVAPDGKVQPIGSKILEDGSIVRPDGSVIRPDKSILRSDGNVVAPDGSVVREDGSVIRPDGSIVHPDGKVQPIGSKILEDGSIVRPDESVVRPDKSIVRSDGKIVGADGSIHPKGSVVRPDGTVVHPDGSVVPSEGRYTRSSERLIRTFENEQDGSRRPDAPIEKYDSSDGTVKISKKPSKEVEKIDRRSSSEVPDLVSKLSSKVIPSSMEPSDTSRHRKKRSSKLEIIPCTCPGICNCIICSSDIMEKRNRKTGSTEPEVPNNKVCGCKGSPKKNQRDPEIAKATQAYTFTAQNDPHPPHCKCKSCRCDPCVDPCKRTCEAFLRMTNYDTLCRNRQKCKANAEEDTGSRKQRSRISIEDVFKPTFKKEQESTTTQDIFKFEHRVGCECIDCLCSPMMQDLVSTRQLQVKDEKQIYQVSTIKCACPNTIKGSKIPVSTNPAVPKIKSSVVSCNCDNCQCSPCADDSKRQGPSTGVGGSEKADVLPTTEEIMKMTPEQLKDLCDCDPCNCDICYNRPGAGAGAGTEGGTDKKAEAEICCCKPGCTCELCQVEEMKQQIEKLRQEIEALKTTKPAKPRRAPGQPDECECEICACPNDRPDGHPDDCDCELCQCPEGPNKATAPSGEGGEKPPADHPADCDCEVCQCPMSPLKAKPRTAGHPPDCDCEICACPLAPAAGDTMACNCGDSCPCPGGPKNKKKEMKGCTCKPQCLCPGGPIPSCDCAPECFCSPCADPRKKPKLACDCNPCLCSPCADPKIGKPQDSSHSPSCICPQCACVEAAKPEPHQDNCTCDVCKCDVEGDGERKGEKDQIHDVADQCDCSECKCGEDQPSADHPDGCICDVCICAPENDFPHPEGCTCDICKCAESEEPTHTEGCTCDICKCAPPEEPTHPEGCTCDVCQCKPEEEEKDICICPDPCKCDEQEQTSELGKKECTCGDNCNCDRGDTAAAKIQVNVEMGTMEDAATHAKECICTECVCAEGGDSEAGGGKCVCNSCACPDCYYKSPSFFHPKNCQCSACTCIDCCDTDNQDNGPAGAADASGTVCKCVECKCDPCTASLPPKFKCKCGVCTCIDCEGIDASTTTAQPAKDEKVVAEPLPKNRSCHCIECYCDDCNNEKKKGSKARPDIVIKVGPPKKAVTTETEAAKGEIKCTCLHCICYECVTKETSGKTGDHQKNPDCKCAQCQCSDCGADTKAVATKDAACHCSTCTCPECSTSKKEAETHGEVTESKSKDAACHSSTCKCPDCTTNKSTEEHGDNCKCPTCICTTCQDLPSIKKDAECHCTTCKCPECSTTSTETHASDCKCTTCTCNSCDDVPPLNKDAECHCSTCKCTECTGKDKVATGRAGASPSGGAEPPMFEIPQKIDCDCKTCTCVICSTKGAAGKEGIQESSADAQGFQIPERIPCACKQCTCPLCNTESQGPSGNQQVAAQFQVPERLPCICKNCTCCICAGLSNKKEGAGNEAETFQTPQRMACNCKNCTCIDCTKGGGAKEADIENRPRGGGAFHRPTKIPCFCNACQCVVCKYGGGKKLPPGSAGDKFDIQGLAGDKFEVPVRLPCQCRDPCKCIICSQNPVHDTVGQSAPTVTIKSSNIPASRPKSAPGGISTESCDCTTVSSICRCPECTAEKPSQISAKVGNSTVRANAKVGINKQISYAGPTTKGSNKYSTCACVSCPDTSLKIEASSQFGPPSISSAKDLSCVCPDCCACEKESVNLSTMDNATLAKKIASDTRENCACKEQIKEIKSALNSIKSACTDVEKKAMKKPLIKQASDFNQTMSGLKLALINLQEKCKAKDKMIYVMIGELRNRASSQTLANVLNTCTGDAPDYDRAEDVKEKVGCNYLYPVTEEKHSFDEKMAKAVETERSSRKKKSKPCKCGKIHKNKNNKNVDLTGFEVVDIRKITHDSIIIKWKPPKSNLITGYDIFINGVNKSKVMSGGRTSAMIDSIDLSSTIQITIYAVTKCGRCEPPAIAIYEIISQG